MIIDLTLDDNRPKNVITDLTLHNTPKTMRTDLTQYDNRPKNMIIDLTLHA